MIITHAQCIRWLERYAALLTDQQTYLTQLDAAIGDADHGVNMQRGFQAVLAKLPSATAGDLGALFKLVGMTLVSTVGGASGPLYGTFFLQMATACAGKTQLTPTDWASALEAGVKGVMTRGKAVQQDKTMLDALLPALEAYHAAVVTAEDDLSAALSAAASAADAGIQATIPLVARKGRASYLGERSAGHPDPGAASSALLLRAAAETLATP